MGVARAGEGDVSMERLTFEGNFCDIAMCRENPCPYNGMCSQRQTWERLKAYEDTSLEPEQVVELKSFTQGGIHKIDDGWKHVQELLQAEQDGRLVVLPCKVGDSVYFTLLGRIIEKPVFSIVSFSSSARIYCAGTSEYFRPEDFGKTVFLTREEAEAALKGGEG